MKRFYQILGGISAVCFVISLPLYGMAFSKLFLFLLTAGCFAMAGLVHTRQGGGRYARIAGRTAMIGTILFALWALSFVLVGARITLAGHSDADAAQADTVFVLGAGIRGDQPTQLLRERLATAVAVMQNNPDVHIIVCGGQGPDEDYAEAAVMYRWMTEHGADASRITMESASHDTIENIKNAVAICEQNGWDTDNVAVLSNNFHLFRARHLMRKCGLTPRAIAAPCGNAGKQLLMTVREYFSLVKLVLRGGW